MRFISGVTGRCAVKGEDGCVVTVEERKLDKLVRQENQSRSVFLE